MPIGTDGSISSIRNKEVRAKLYRQEQRQKKKDKLAKRIARKQAEQRGEHVEKGFTRTIENTREWLGDSEEYSDPRTRPAQVEVDEQTGDVRVDLGTLADLFPASDAPPRQLPDGRLAPDAKVLITTSPGKPSSPYTREFLDDLLALLGGKTRADIVPRRSPKFELGKVARWARGRGYGAIAVVGEDHSKPTTLTLSLLPSGPTAHFRLSGITLSKDIKGHAKPTSHPPELVLNHFQTPLGLSLASLLSHLFLPPSAADVLARQGYAGRQVVLAQNSRDFVFVRRYRYMFALKSHQLGATKKKRVGLEKRLGDDPEDDDTIKTRFQEIGPRLTVKMRWIRRGALGETGDERERREKAEEVARGQTRQPGESLSLGAPELMAEFGTVQEGEDPDKGEVGGHSKVKGKGRGGDLGDGEHEDDDEADEERQAAQDIGLDADDDSSQPNFDFNGVAAAAEAEAAVLASRSSGPTRASEDDDPATTSRPTKRPRTTPRKRTKPAHPLLRPARSPTPPPGVSAMGEPEAVPLPPRNGKKKLSGADASVLSTVGKTWHAGKGQGGVRDGKDRREWNWEAKMQVSRRKFFL